MFRNEDEAESCLNKILCFICIRNDENIFNILTSLPKELIYQICVYSICPDENSSLMMIMRLLEGYCGLNESIPHNYQRNYKEEVNTVLLEYGKNAGVVNPLSRNTGFILFRLCETIPINEISHEDGLYYINKMLYLFYSIDITDFYPDTPVFKFLTKNNDCIHTSYYSNWAQILKNSDQNENASQDIQLLLAHPYLEAAGKTKMLEHIIDVIFYYDTLRQDSTFLNEYGNFLLSSHHELYATFEVALEKGQYGISNHLFCMVNQLEIPPAMIYFPYNEKYFSCRMLLDIWLSQYITKDVNPFLIIKLLDHLSKFPMELTFVSYLYSLHDIYQLLLDKKDFIPDWEVVAAKFVQSFVPDDFLYYTVCHYPSPEDITNAIHDYLKTKKPDHGVTRDAWMFYTDCAKFQYIRYDAGIEFNNIPIPRLHQEKPELIIMSPLQGAITLAIFYPANATDITHLIVELIKRNPDYLKMKDSISEDIYDYLNFLRDAVISCPDMKNKGFTIEKFNVIFNLIDNDYKHYFFKRIGTFFCGSKKYNNESVSIVSQLSGEIADKIACFTMKR